MPGFERNCVTQFIISPLFPTDSGAEHLHFQRLLVYLGGVRIPAGFVFPNQQQRQIAWEVLCDRCGARFFEKRDLRAAPDPA